MFVPAEYRVDDEDRLWALVRQAGLGLVVSAEDGQPPLATLFPCVVRPAEGTQARLWGHMALANPQWRSFRPDREVLCVFRGPDAYVSPTWYVNRPYAPTWNFAQVHVYGYPTVLRSDPHRTRRVLEQTVEEYEGRQPQPWRLSSVPEDYVQSLLAGVAAFEIEVTRMEGQFKLSQDKPEADRRAVIAHLLASDDTALHATARLMEEELAREQRGG
ncbi:MAG TPA: FMN-binding negative transcriptional regulator [Acidimicrobiales bacterium]|nr:FMN-binding negative transcriptional regulator [Acidimicrobiales bacterium]